MKTPRLELINKPWRKKWYSVFLVYTSGEKSERAKFISPGDAHDYAKQSQDDPYQMDPADTIQVEC